jgi:hypothetical protein
MYKGLGPRQRDILAKLAHSEKEWMTVRELVDERPNRWGHPVHRYSDIESTRRAVRKLEAAGLVETRLMKELGPTWRLEEQQRFGVQRGWYVRDHSKLERWYGQTQLHVRLSKP